MTVLDAAAVTQLALVAIDAQASAQGWSAMRRYLARRREDYLAMNLMIQPDLDRWQDIWDRLAFAILTANTEARHAHRALWAVRECRGAYQGQLTGITPDRVAYVNALPLGEPIRALLKVKGEPWHDYRLRIRDAVNGLATTKASYAVGLLYPLAADVCCLDVWMQRLILRRREHAFQWLSDEAYQAMEEAVRAEARRVEGRPVSASG